MPERDKSEIFHLTEASSLTVNPPALCKEPSTSMPMSFLEYRTIKKAEPDLDDYMCIECLKLLPAAREQRRKRFDTMIAQVEEDRKARRQEIIDDLEKFTEIHDGDAVVDYMDRRGYIQW